MSKLMDLDARSKSGIKLLLYGVPGSGKTRLAYTAALDERMSPVLGINAFGNPESIRTYKYLPDIIDISQIKDLNDPYEWLHKGQPENSPWAKEMGIAGKKYKTVVLDTITDIQRFGFNEAMKAQQLPGVLPIKREWEHFNKVLGLMIMLASTFYSLCDTQGLHVIMTAHEKSKEDRMNGIDRFQPLLDGQSDQEVPGKAMMIGRMQHVSLLSPVQMKDTKDARKEAAESQVACFTKPTKHYVAKDQYGTGYDYYIDPTMTIILDAIMQAGT